MSPPRLYLDSSSLSRLYDISEQERVNREATAVRVILKLAERKAVTWCVSDILEEEVARNPRTKHRNLALAATADAGEHLRTSPAAFAAGMELARLGMGAFDAMHLSVAAKARCDALLTCDDKFLRQARRHSPGLGFVLRTANPTEWLQSWVQSSRDEQ